MNINELEEIKQKYIKEVNFRKLGDTSGVDYKYDIMVCGGTGCKSCKRGNRAYLQQTYGLPQI